MLTNFQGDAFGPAQLHAKAHSITACIHTCMHIAWSSSLAVASSWALFKFPSSLVQLHM